jgi:hypothetical protein
MYIAGDEWRRAQASGGRVEQRRGERGKKMRETVVF